MLVSVETKLPLVTESDFVLNNLKKEFEEIKSIPTNKRNDAQSYRFKALRMKIFHRENAKRSRNQAPQWAKDLIRMYCPNYTLEWKFHPSNALPMCNHRAWGRCYWNKMKIVLHTRDCSDSPPSIRTFKVMLHEIAHALDAMHNNAHKLGNIKRTAHDKYFWKICFDLYKKHGIVEYAAEHEHYASGRKYGKAILMSGTL